VPALGATQWMDFMIRGDPSERCALLQDNMPPRNSLK